MIRQLEGKISKNDHGASAVLIAFSMVVLLGFAALAVDATGLGFNERRQAQSAADVGALAAVQFAVPDDLGNGACTGSATDVAECNGAIEAIEVANQTLDDPSLADWSDSSKCDTPPAGFTATSVSACVAFNSNFQRAWVRIPTIEKPTTIARAIGIDSVDTSADAIADQDFQHAGAVLPFLLPGNAADTDYGCLKTAPTPSWGSCEDLPSLGNFGAMDFFLYGNPNMGTSTECGGNANNRFASNIARGVDHPLGLYPQSPPGPPGTHEQDACPIFGAEPDTVNSQPGNLTFQNIEEGFLYGASYYSTVGSYPGRIQNPAGDTIRSSQGPQSAAVVDVTPLWDHLLSGLPAPCNNVTDPDEMEACINWAKNNDAVIFDDSIASAQRFGFTPELWEDDPSNPSASYHIRRLRPVYVDSLYFQCNNSGSCQAVHTPGVSNDDSLCNSEPSRVTCGIPANGNNNLVAVTAYILDVTIMPDVAKEPPPGSSAQRFYNLSE